MTALPPGPDSLLALAFASDPQVCPRGRRVAFVHTEIGEEDPKKPLPDFARPRYRSQLWWSDGGEARPLTAGEGRDTAPRWAPHGETLAFVRAPLSGPGQLMLLPLGGGEARRVTQFATGVSDPQWSPDGNYVAFQSRGGDEDKRDERGEARVITAPRYRFNGLDWLPQRPARLWLLDVASGEVSEWHAPEVGITAYAWRADSAGVLFVSSPDERAAALWQQEIYALEVAGGVRQVSDWGGAVTHLMPHPDGTRYALVGRPGGSRNPEYLHLYLCAPGEAGGTRLDVGHDYSVGNIVGGDAHVGAFPERPAWLDDRTLLFSSTVRGSCGLFRATVDGGVEVHQHDPEAVIAAFSANSNGVAVIRERADRYPEVELNGAQVTRLHDRVPFPVRSPVRVSFAAGEHGEGEGWVLRPDAPNAPALLSIHGGPHTDYGHAFMHEFQLFAARGYAVCYSNPRGSVGYGQAWVDAIHGRWGTVDTADLLAFFDRCLETVPGLDGARTAVMGGSYGGYMTNWITAHTARFTAAITDRSICNLVSFGGTSDIGMRFWDDELGANFHRRADVAKLWDLSPLQYVEDVKTPTLIVHSALDHRCPIEQAEQWYAALTLHGVPVRFVRFPGEDHELSRSGRPDRRMTRLDEYLSWLDRWLGQGSEEQRAKSEGQAVPADD